MNLVKLMTLVWHKGELYAYLTQKYTIYVQKHTKYTKIDQIKQKLFIYYT